MNYGFLFSHILHNICNTLSDGNPSISIVELAVLVAQDLIPHLPSVISDNNILFLWKTMWNTNNASIANILLSFFKSSIPFIDSKFFSPFILYAAESQNFTSTSYSLWECCCYLWKAVNDVNQYIEMKMPILNMTGFVAVLLENNVQEFDSVLHDPLFAVRSLICDDTTIADTIESLLMCIISFESGKKIQSLNMLIEFVFYVIIISFLKLLSTNVQKEDVFYPRFASFIQNILSTMGDSVHLTFSVNPSYPGTNWIPFVGILCAMFMIPLLIKAVNSSSKDILPHSFAK